MASDKDAAETSDVEEVELFELKRPAIDEEQYNKVFNRRYAAPNTSIHASRSEPDVLTSHLHVNFDEKDYTSHKSHSAKYHEPLRRLSRGHSHHKELSSLDKKEHKHKKHKHRHEHKDEKKKKEKTDKELVAKLPGIKEIKETHEDSITSLDEEHTPEFPVGDDHVDSEVFEEDVGIVMKIKPKQTAEKKEEPASSKIPEPKGQKETINVTQTKPKDVTQTKHKDEPVQKTEIANEKRSEGHVEPSPKNDKKSDKKQEEKKGKDDPKKVKGELIESKPLLDSKGEASGGAEATGQLPKESKPENKDDNKLIKDDIKDDYPKSESTPNSLRKRKSGLAMIDVSTFDDGEDLLQHQDEVQLSVLSPKDKADLSLVEVLPQIDEDVVSDVRKLEEEEVEKSERQLELEEEEDSHHSLAPLDLRDPQRRHHRRRRHHHHQRQPGTHRTISEREALVEKYRIRSGALTLSETEPALADLALKLPTERDEALSLEKRDIEDIAWHRFEDLRGLRRRRPHLRKPRLMSGMLTRRRGSTSSDIAASLQQFPLKYDHSPHEAFIELQELTGKDSAMRWRETARWIKFEEDVEASNRWGKPHVASLTFHSLLELRKGLEKGTVLLDLEQFDMQSIAEAMVENMVITDQIAREESSTVLSALLAKHKHQYQESGNLPRRPSFYNLMSLTPNASRRSLQEEGNGVENTAVDDEKEKDESTDMIRLKIDDDQIESPPTSHTIDVHDDSQAPLCVPDKKEDKDQTKAEVTFGPTTTSETPQQAVKKNESDVKSRVPIDAEATNVLVGTLEGLTSPVTAFVRLAKGCYLGNVTEVAIPVRFLFVMLGPEEHLETYHEVGRSIATLMSDQVFHDLAYYSEAREDLLMAINEFLEDTVVLPPGEWDRQLLIPVLLSQSKVMAKRRKQAKAINAIASHAAEEEENPLKRTGRFCGGLIQDIKHRAKTYISDFKDGFNLQCFMVTIFLYFAVFAPNIAFGGLLAEKTNQWLGVSEVIFASCMGGIVFALFAGQPLIIIGATGPVLVFEQTIYQFCEQFNIEFLPWRCWIGLWVLIIMFLVVALEGCFLVRYFTRFTEEVFACLISIIFIYESISFLFKVFKANPLSRDYIPPLNATTLSGDVTSNSIPVQGEPNTALISAILLFGTYFVAFYMRKFRNSHFFGRRARRMMSDFGILIAMSAMVILDVATGDKVITPKVNVGDTINEGFRPTLHQKRGWFINPIGLEQTIKPGWVFAAVIPALFIGILLFMETELTGVLLNKKEHFLQKKPGFNMDLLLMGFITLLCSLFGLPWMCAATVRSVSHFNALSVWSTSHAPGEKPYLVEVKEQRVTNVLIHVLTGFSILLAPVLHLIPVPVLFGVLLYLGLSSLSHIQLINRLIMMLMPPKHHPDVRYVRKVQTNKIYWFTAIQLLCLIILVIVKLTSIAPAFPFFIICLIPVRRLLSKCFTQDELEELDNEEEDDDSDFDEYDTINMPI